MTMITEISPRRLDAVPGQPQQLELTITNTGDVIGGYLVRLLGADPGWVELDESDLSLFPDESRTIAVTVTVPHGIPAGERRLAVQVRELTPPESSSIQDLIVVVPEDRKVELRPDPAVVTAGRTGHFGLLIDNTGNTTVDGRLTGTDPEDKVRLRFRPEAVTLAPGEHAVVELEAKARRPLFGNPVVRMIDLDLDRPDRRPGEAPPLAVATFLQRAAITRGALGLFGLLAAITVFALVITVALTRIVGQTAADRDLALQIAAARDAGGGSGSASISGQVRLLTSGTPVPRVTVSVFAASDTVTPVVSTATGDDGAYRVADLPAGDYKLTFEGAGFVQLWYPKALSPDNGEAVTVAGDDELTGVDVALGGVPATMTGAVKGDDVAGATLTVLVPADSPETPGAIVTTAAVGADGTFSLADIPSPSVYLLEVSKPGFATSQQRIDVSAGEVRNGLNITLRRGDGLISGTVRSPTGPLGGVTLTATSGQTTVTTVSVDSATETTPAGGFVLRGLPTPGRYTVVASAEDHASQTVTLTLGPGQRLTGISLTLPPSSGSISGSVSAVLDPQEGPVPATGVEVLVTGGEQSIRTATRSDEEGAGAWEVDGLALPGTYTVTFSRSDLASQSVTVSLDERGAIEPGPSGSGVTSSGVSISLLRATATLHGTIQQSAFLGSATSQPRGEVAVQLTSGERAYATTTASVPASRAGQYRIEGIEPGTYTVSVSVSGARSITEIVNLVAGQEHPFSRVLDPAASIAGVVRTRAGGAVGEGWVVDIFRTSEYPMTLYRTTVTDGGGRFAFDDLDAPETYVVQVQRNRASLPSGSASAQLDASQRLDGLVVVADD